MLTDDRLVNADEMRIAVVPGGLLQPDTARWAEFRTGGRKISNVGEYDTKLLK